MSIDLFFRGKLHEYKDKKDLKDRLLYDLIVDTKVYDMLCGGLDWYKRNIADTLNARKNIIAFNKAKRYLKNLDVDLLAAKSSKLQHLCVNETSDGEHYFHHMPIKKHTADEYFDIYDHKNWDLTEKQLKIVEQILEELGTYSDAIYTLVYTTPEGEMNGYYRGDEENFQVVKDKMLPPWIVFPWVDKCSIFWRMGEGEAYACLFSSFIDRLCCDKREKYVRKYPMPKYYENGNKFEAECYIRGSVSAIINDWKAEAEKWKEKAETYKALYEAEIKSNGKE